MKKIVTNRKANFEYTVIENITAGIQLVGSEVKNIRANKVSISEAYCFVDNGEMFIKGMHIAEYTQSGNKHYNHAPLRDRKLLLKKKEIIKLHAQVSQQGLTLIPLAILITDSGFIKIEVGLCKGKKTYDKSKSIRDKDIKRDTDRTLKNN